MDPAQHQYGEYWFAPQGQYQLPPHQTTVFELPQMSADLSKVPSLSGSPVSSTFDQFPAPVHHGYYPQVAEETVPMNAYQLPMTPPDFNSEVDSPYGSPRPVHHQPDQMYLHAGTPIPGAAPAEKQHATSGRRRAQNRAAQRAFRERKEKHARDLEAKLNEVNDKYRTLEISHNELLVAHEKLRQTIELLTKDDEDAEINSNGKARRRASQGDTVRELLKILHGETLKGVGTLKTESSN